MTKQELEQAIDRAILLGDQNKADYLQSQLDTLNQDVEFKRDLETIIKPDFAS